MHACLSPEFDRRLLPEEIHLYGSGRKGGEEGPGAFTADCSRAPEAPRRLCRRNRRALISFPTGILSVNSAFPVVGGKHIEGEIGRFRLELRREQAEMALVMARSVEFALLPQIVPVVAHGGRRHGRVRSFLNRLAACSRSPIRTELSAVSFGVPGAVSIPADQSAPLKLFQLRLITGEGAMAVKGEKVEVSAAVLFEQSDPAVVGAGNRPPRRSEYPRCPRS